MAKPANEPEVFAVVNGEYLLPLQEALQLLTAMTTMRRVSRTYKSDGRPPFEFRKGSEENTITVVSTAHYAAMCLEVDTPQ